MFHEKYDKESPPARTILAWKNRFNETLSILPKTQNRDHSNQRLSDVKKEEIIGAFGDNPNTSQRKVASTANVSVSTVNKVLKNEGIKAWKYKIVQELQPSDYVNRKQIRTVHFE